MGYIYWIASYPKSGNTWLRAFLTALVTEGEASGDLGALRRIAPDDNMGSYYRPFMTQPVETATLEEFARVRPEAQRAMAEDAEGFVFVKTHNMLSRHLGTPTINLEVTAGAIYLVRNPLDVAVSYSAFRSQSIDEAIMGMNAPNRILARPPLGAYQVPGSWGQNVESWTRTPHDRLLVVRYEDMVQTPTETFSGIVKFLRMDVDAKAIAGAIEASSFEALQASEASGGFDEKPPETEQFFRSGRIDEWRERLSTEQVARIIVPNAGPMRRFGYWRPEFDRLLGQAQPASARAVPGR